MQVSELFRRLSYGELSNLALSGEGSGEIVEAKRPQILQHANDALLRLHSRFFLREGNLLLQQCAGIRHYHLKPENALTTGTETRTHRLFILDSEHMPFRDDVIKIVTVRNHLGHEVTLNDPDGECSMFTPQPQVLQILRPAEGLLVGVDYQARHPVLAGLDDEIDLPETLEKALTAYIGYLTYSAMNTDTSTAKAQEHLSVYEAVCAEVTGMDLVSSSRSSTNTRFAKGGWI